MAQKTFADNDVLTASDVNTYLSHEGGAWTSYTPTISQGATTNISKTVNYCRYARAGRLITVNFDLTLTGAGTAGSSVTVTVPVAAASTAALAGGGGHIYDASTTTRYVIAPSGLSTTTIGFTHDTSGANLWGQAPSIALASGDLIRVSFTYEAAT